jgi:ABC-type sulfate/molybdate transport systems ATPase subunit
MANVILEFGAVSILDKVRNFSLAIEGGSIVELKGPAACGKTLLFKSILGIVEEYQGVIQICGKDQHERWREKVGFIFESPNLISNMNIYQNLLLVINHLYPEMDMTQKRRMIDNELELYQVSKLRDLRPAQLTPGQLRLLCFLRANIIRPELLLWDNALAGYADWPRHVIEQKLQDIIKRQGAIVLFSNRDLRPDCQNYQLFPKLFAWNGGGWERETG